MPARRVAIIGAGMGGLAAGVYGQLAGLDTTIFEMHGKPGGLVLVRGVACGCLKRWPVLRPSGAVLVTGASDGATGENWMKGVLQEHAATLTPR